MKITRKNLPKSLVELTIEESVEKIAKFRSQALEYLRKNAQIRGFRPGAVIPENVLVKQF
jgi:FKBP-type peptidyl-prolyl cis-trans isomerase (trigger factor)